MDDGLNASNRLWNALQAEQQVEKRAAIIIDKIPRQRSTPHPENPQFATWTRGAHVKAYLDSNVVSAIAKDDTPAESEALDRLLAASDVGAIDLVTSELTFDEIKRSFP